MGWGWGCGGLLVGALLGFGDLGPGAGSLGLGLFLDGLALGLALVDLGLAFGAQPLVADDLARGLLEPAFDLFADRVPAARLAGGPAAILGTLIGLLAQLVTGCFGPGRVGLDLMTDGVQALGRLLLLGAAGVAEVGT